VISVERLAGKSDLFRSVNDKILELSSSLVDTVDLVCECPDERCTRAMRMTAAEYAAMAVQPGLHAVVPGHERVDPVEIVARADGYVVVRTLSAVASARAGE
jgi:hypothetical protein